MMSDYHNDSQDLLRVDLCVIGGGSGGLSVAAGAVQMGASTVLIEHNRMGGDCLNSGCVPSKALLAAAKTASGIAKASSFGIKVSQVSVDAQRVHDHVHDVIASIAPHDSVERFTELGVHVIQASARFIDHQTVAAGSYRIRARRFVVATGSGPSIPPIPGLDQVPYLTNETIFDSQNLIANLAIIGAGPIGIEMAQAHRRLGSTVTVLEREIMLPRDDPELVEILRNRLHDEGIEIRERVDIKEIVPTDQGAAIIFADGQRLEVSHILVAAGRRVTIDGLDLEVAGIKSSPRGIITDERLRTTNKKVFAIGDVAGGPQFTHIAGYHASIVIRNALFRMPTKVDYRALPWVTYTDPELAQVGLTEAQAQEKYRTIKVLRFDFAENDRARAERTSKGLIKVITKPNGQVLGVSVVGPHAGELLLVWSLVITHQLKISAVANLIAPYPTLSEVNKRVAGSFFIPMLFSERTKRLVRWLAKLG